MPERRAAPRFETARPGLFHKPCDRVVAGGSEIKWLVELARARQFRLARAQAGIFSDLPKAHVVEAGDPYGTLLRDFIERFANFGVWAPLRDAQIACGADGAGNAQAEVAVGEENPSAIFRDEGMIVFQLAADGFDFLPGARCEDEVGDFLAPKLP